MTAAPNAVAQTEGLHHVTAIAGDPQKNIDFYITGLGLRLVKKTVNFDDPGTYHLYYGDEAGRPGSLMTFFPWRGIQRGRIGAGQSTSTAFSVPAGSLGWWVDHFASVGAEARITSTSSSEERLLVHDPDGLQIELVATTSTTRATRGTRRACRPSTRFAASTRACSRCATPSAPSPS